MLNFLRDTVYCPDCGYGRWNGHAPECRRLSREQAIVYLRTYMEIYHTYKALAATRFAEMELLRHENNKLRKAMYPAPPKE